MPFKGPVDACKNYLIIERLSKNEVWKTSHCVSVFLFFFLILLKVFEEAF